MPKDEFDFDDPMELSGVALLTEEDTTGAMCECFIEEFLRLGYNSKQVLALFRNPEYLGMHMVLQNRGEPFVLQQIGEVFARWGRPVNWPESASGQRQNQASLGHERTVLAVPDAPSTAATEFDPTLADPMGAAIPKLNL